MALNCTNGRSLQELPEKVSLVEQIQLRLKVLRLHKLAYDRISNLLSNSEVMKRWAIHFRMWNCSTPFFVSAAGIGPIHKFEDLNYRGIYNNLRGCLRDDDPNVPEECSSILGHIQESSLVSKSPTRFGVGLLDRYKKNLFTGEVSYLDHAFFRKILSNSMFFDLEIIYLHTVLPVQNQQEIQKCIEKIMVQSWFNDHPPKTDAIDFASMESFPNKGWDEYCMQLDFDERKVDMNKFILPSQTVDGMHRAIESLRVHIHSFLELAPKAQDTLRIMFPPEALVTFACTHIGQHFQSHIGQHFQSQSQLPKYLRHYVCAIADILLGYTSPLDIRTFENVLGKNIEDLSLAEKPHAFVSYNALHCDASAMRTKGRDRCLSLRNLWDALPHICRNLPDAKFLTVKLGLAARYIFFALMVETTLFILSFEQACLRDCCFQKIRHLTGRTGR